MAPRRDPWPEAVRRSATLLACVLAAGGVTLLLPGLKQFGIVPRTVAGLPGIALAPLLHASAAHLFANALPLFVLLVLLFADRAYRPGRSLAAIWIVSGLGTWLIGRGHAVHLGASSIVYGLVTYLLVAGFRLRSWRAALVALLVLVLYGGLWYGVLPRSGPVSWEGHLCGALAGAWAAWRQHR
jgi:membrane associated rhomboid family serine protease